MNKKEIIEFVPIDGELYISLKNANKSLDIMQKRIEKQKEVIDKAIEYINQHWVIDDPVWFKNDLLEILEDYIQELEQGSDE